MIIINNNNLSPFLKWPGGKRWLIRRDYNIFPQDYNHYYEPFVGSGAIFFKLKPTVATLSDINPELIDMYVVMRDFSNELGEVLKRHQVNHCKEYYYEIRKSENFEMVEKAGRFLYLNRTCYNGMYRVNKKGKFNVPIGTKSNCIYDLDLFQEYSKRLKETELLVSDFGKIIQRARKNDLVFTDPPYTVSHNQNSFIKYNNKLFSWEDQERLLEELVKARDRGAYIVSTNANYRQITDMYEKHGFYLQVLNRFSSIAAKATKRKTTEEVLITSYKTKLENT